jgi:hypothetical protein
MRDSCGIVPLLDARRILHKELTKLSVNFGRMHAAAAMQVLGWAVEQ